MLSISLLLFYYIIIIFTFDVINPVPLEIYRHIVPYHWEIDKLIVFTHKWLYKYYLSHLFTFYFDFWEYSFFFIKVKLDEVILSTN